MSGNETKKRLYLIDGSALAYRSYFAFIRNPLINSKGENTGAAFGFTRALMKILEEEKPDYLAVVFDTPEPTFRHHEYPDYKATREKMPDDLVSALPRIRQLITAMQIPILELPGFEADDVMGTLARQAENRGLITLLVTGDKDFMQLVNPHIKIYNLRKAGEEAEIIDEEGVRQKIELPPAQVIDYLGLTGDASDNVPGVNGIGPKRAVQLLTEFGTIERVLENASRVSPQKIGQSLIENAELARLSKRLVTIRCDVPIRMDWDAMTVTEMNRPVLAELFKELEFRTLARQFTEAEIDQKVNYQVVASAADLDQLVERLAQSGSFVFDLETTSVDPMRAQIVGMSFAIQPRQAFYIPIQLPRLDEIEPLNLKPVLEKIGPLLQNPGYKKSGQNIKYDMLVLSQYGIQVQGIDFDTMVASYLLNPSGRQHNLDSISMQYLNYKKIPTTDLIGTGKKQITMAEVPLAKICQYACEDADIALRLRLHLEPMLQNAGLMDLFQEIEIPLISVLKQMEFNGVCLDDLYLAAMSKDLDQGLRKIETEIYHSAGIKFNINSPQQLAKIFFEKLKLPSSRRTKTGFSTDVAVLEELAKQHPLPRLILDYRQLAKLKSTYVDALPRLVNPKTGRIHTSYNQTVAATGRLSSSDPNLQNIPIRTEIGRQIRRAFIPQDADHVILDADYSQIELRIMAHLSGDQTLRASFINEEDVHRRTAALVFHLEPEAVTQDQRRRAKEVNFGIMYGMGAYGLSQRLEISVEEADQFIQDYFSYYPGVKEYRDSTIAEARKLGYVKTLLNRRRFLPEIHDKNRNIREFAERTAVNTPIQGTAADMIKVAMIRIHQRIEKQGLDSKMILQVHDELVFDVRRREIDIMRALVQEEMEQALPMQVPVKVEIGIGPSWLEAH